MCRRSDEHEVLGTSQDLLFSNLHLKKHPRIESGFLLEDETPAMRGEILVPELHELDYTVRGRLLEYYLASSAEK